ncbi:hypothetical protein P4O66_001983 [Electrophorus voltai]|uniref:Peptidase S1 domain-containing protein n=1 Tax=Electrophorus voltai TaxID=2609070 RepID=A0AAD8ZUY7_9TELE|nr:hypothetical protein P4O66_001983 [Electrophorus voltai]
MPQMESSRNTCGGWVSAFLTLAMSLSSEHLYFWALQTDSFSLLHYDYHPVISAVRSATVPGPRRGDNMTVMMGAHDLSEKYSSTHMEVKFYHIYPEYNPQGFNDIMLLQLKGIVKNSTVINWIPLRKRRQQIKNKTICSIAGWGRNMTNGHTSTRLMEVNVSIVGRQACTKAWHKFYSAPSMICTAGRGGFCKGDSGGPLVCNNKAVGIVSKFEWENCDYPHKPNIYTKIAKFLPWIRAIIKTKK